MKTYKKIFNLLESNNYIKAENKRKSLGKTLNTIYYYNDNGDAFTFFKIGNGKTIITFYTNFKKEYLAGNPKYYNIDIDETITIIKALEIKARKEIKKDDR